MSQWWLTCLLLTSLPLLMCTTAAGQESKENMKAYPDAEEGMVRYVLHLEPQEDESLFRVQLLVGQTVTIDEVNRYFFAGELIEESIEGWGFPKYTLKNLGPLAGTRVGVDPDAPKVKRFITLGGEPSLPAIQQPTAPSRLRPRRRGSPLSDLENRTRIHTRPARLNDPSDN